MDETSPKRKDMAKQKASVIFRVRSGSMTAKDGAKLLGLSRKSYFEWEARGLKGMLLALEEKPSGRPKKEVDSEKDEMQKRIKELEEELFVAKKTMEVRKLMAAWEEMKSGKPGKKTPKKKSSKG